MLHTCQFVVVLEGSAVRTVIMQAGAVLSAAMQTLPSLNDTSLLEQAC